MKVEILSTELIKPYTSTPQSLRHHNLSIVDELIPALYFPVILFYPAETQGCGKQNATRISRCMHLKKSLSKVLTRFYPFAGRYVKESYMVDCNDQGAEFVEAKVDICLDEIIGQGKNLNVELLNSLLSRPVGAADEITDPALSVQVSTFACGGFAIGVLSSHKIADISTTSTLIEEWAADAKMLWRGCHQNHAPVSPNWNSASLFPRQDVSGLTVVIPGAKELIADHKMVTKKFLFSNSAISEIREKARLDESSERLPSKVQSVCGVIGKAIIDIHIAHPEKPRGFAIIQPVNMRERTDPPLPKHQCGNLILLSFVQSMAGIDGVELKGLIDLSTRSVKRTVEICKTLFAADHKGQLVSQGFHEAVKGFVDPEISCAVSLTDWCKCPFYEADFGWGKPVWVSSTEFPTGNTIYLLRDKNGDGIEAWVSLNIDDMPKFEQDSNIIEFTT